MRLLVAIGNEHHCKALHRRHLHPPSAERAIQTCNPACAIDHPNRQPKRRHLSVRNNCANMAEEFSGPQHPLPASEKHKRVLYATKINETHIYSACICWCEQSVPPKFNLTEAVLSYFPCTNVLILNPRVGHTLLTSSPLSHFRIVVFPALSRPLCKFRFCMHHIILAYRKSIRIPLSFSLFLRIIVRSPML